MLNNFYIQQIANSNKKFNYNTLVFIKKNASIIPSNAVLNNTSNSLKEKEIYSNAPFVASSFGPLKTIAYEVQQGDNYWDLSKKTGTSLDTILSFNKIDKAHAAIPGTIVYIPQRDGILHERKNNETLEKISSNYSVAIKKISYFNPNVNADYYFIPDASFNLSQRMKLLGNEFFKPVNNIRLTGFFGFRRHPITKLRTFHKGIDFGGRIGDPIYAAKAGRIIFTGFRNGYGLTVIISHGNNTKTLYAHLSKILTTVGAQVGNKQRIGNLGNTGRSTGPHLHFEIHKNNKPVNPLPITEIFK